MVSLWVHVDADTGRPVALPPEFHRCYDEAAAGRTVSARLQHSSAVPVEAEREPWALRFTDFDLLGHVNNAATWSMVEEVLVRRPHLRPPLRAELEYRTAIERGTELSLATRDHDDALELWIVAGGPGGDEVVATARVFDLPGGAGDRG